MHKSRIYKPTVRARLLAGDKYRDRYRIKVSAAHPLDRYQTENRAACALARFCFCRINSYIRRLLVHRVAMIGCTRVFCIIVRKKFGLAPANEGDDCADLEGFASVHSHN